jgi:hypothetical protein
MNRLELQSGLFKFKSYGLVSNGYKNPNFYEKTLNTPSKVFDNLKLIVP